MSQAPLDLERAGWLERLLARYVAAWDPGRSAARVAAARQAAPDRPREEQALLLADRLLDALALGGRAPSLDGPLGAELAAARGPAERRAALPRLVAQGDLIGDAATLHDNQSGPEERQLELATVLCLGLGEVKLARRLHDAHLAAKQGRAATTRLLRDVERRLAPRWSRAPSAARPVEVGLTWLEARTLAAVASSYFEASSIEEDTVERLLRLSEAEKVDLIEVLVALAWADGRLSPEERRLIEHQIEHAELSADTARRLRAHLERPFPVQQLELTPLAPTARRFVLEKAALLSLIDDDLDPSEVRVLEEVALGLGAGPGELDRTLVEAEAFYREHREALRELGPVAGAVQRLHGLLLERATAAARTNARRLAQEVRETGELAVLLAAASVRPLTREETTKVKAQLIDICKTIPALAIFALPGGGLLLPVLTRVLPFNILPSAFAEE